MFDIESLFGGFDAPLGAFGFVVLIVLITSIASWLKAQAVQETIREAIRAGVPLDAATVRELKRSAGEDEGGGGRGVAGLILIAVAVALILFGFIVGKASDDPQVFPILTAVSLFPGAIGVALLVHARRERDERA
ncbi:hypothetical protein [Parvularcula oceani]|uniref:hypothetical protein n=1 Tax=Parvularcula oceani TaxID=1247963 RepID=UPI00068D7B98|nr:hypothetical protein [Parvularcula oceani]